MRIRAPPGMIYLKTMKKLNIGRPVLHTLPLLYLKHFDSDTGAFFSFPARNGHITKSIFLKLKEELYGFFCKCD